MSRRLIIEILPTGEVRMEAQGFRGRACLRASEPFRRALGIPNEAIQPTTDMWQAEEETRERAKVRNGS